MPRDEKDLDILLGTLDVLVLKTLLVGAESWVRDSSVDSREFRRGRFVCSTARSIPRCTGSKNAGAVESSGGTRSTGSARSITA